jgi:hypothetical protein
MPEIVEQMSVQPQKQESLVDVCSPLVAHARTPATKKPRQCPLYYPRAASNISLLSTPRLAILA